MRIGTGDNSIEMLCLVVGPPHSPASGDFCVAVSVRNQGFSAELDGLWLGSRDFDQFLANLRQLEVTRQGEASLQDMSEQKFGLQLRIAGRKGRASVTGFIARLWIADPPLPATKLEFSFVLDSEFIGAVLRDAEDFRHSGGVEAR